MKELDFVPSGPVGLFGMSQMHQEGAAVLGSLELGSWSRDQEGQTAVGSLGVLADEVTGYSLIASLPVGAWSISTEIWLDIVGRLPREGQLSARGECVQQGSFAQGQFRDSEGRLLALCRQRGRAVPMPREFAAAPLAPWRGTGGLHALLGLDAIGADHSVRFRARSDLVNPRSTLHGGVSLAASEAVASRARTMAGSALRTSSVHIVHVRAVPVQAELVFHVETRHAGRTLWVADVVGVAAGKTCTVARVSAC